ncbi:hypothetical protein ACFLY9_00260, partial [Patescibacteria group bacterium]
SGKNKGGDENQEQQESTEIEDILNDEEAALESEPIVVTEEVDVTEKESDSDADDAPTSENFSTNDQNIGGESVSDVVVGEMEQKGYEGFLRIIFNIDSDSEIPYTTATLNASSNLISLKIKGIQDDNSGINPGNGADVTGSVVSTIFHNVTSEENTSYYSIGVKADTGFYLHTLSDPARIVLDIEEQEVEDDNGQEFAYSKDSQSIEGDTTENAITMAGMSHSDQVSEGAFRILFRLGSVGTGIIPSTTAEIVDYDGEKAIKLVISNMHSDFIASDNYDQEFGNYGVSGMKGSYESNTSTYYIVLKGGERDYKLYYRTAPAQLIVDVKR